ncbi:hypothetical protein CHLRE_16g689001v5 [Chlamydomonas reinhardtii]|uniref:F-box domain-containing protein n=1 Tax=Chlamydomonas reinhardtii TaxID=3055 RepID=A0A2K3CU51_CHLRE|nr:uncharacterized protein CHLRE_16g689001v5 [Chlamydomonas reinhardtii]PNW71809.1 hypothetical protein CHLRE_16g689001v5 [Chlamydomonas reinhardtii]
MASPVLTSCRLLQLPIELQLRVLEELQGKELCLIELVHPELRRLVSDSPYLYMDVHTKEFGRTIAGAKGLTAKAQYTQAYVQARVDNLERQRCVCNALKLRLEQLDELLGQADDVRELLGVPEMMMNEPSLVLSFVGDMEQDVMQERWDTSEDLLAAEEKMAALQVELEWLMARVPSSWCGAAAAAAPAPVTAVSSGCIIA